MLVFKNNYKEILPIFREALQQSDFLSFDCEMTGVTYDIKTDPTKYDTPQFRYTKFREVVKKFELVQVGITFYIKKEGVLKDKSIMDTGNNLEALNNINSSNSINVQLNNSLSKELDSSHNDPVNKFYNERTFTFFLFRNSNIRHLTNHHSYKSENSIFSNFTTCHPAALKFLNNNGFDLNNLVINGINYNKLSFVPQIKQIVNDHIDGKQLPNSILYLSKKNEEILIYCLQMITKFLLSQKSESEGNCKRVSDKKLIISNLNPSVINYLLSLNYKKLLKLQNFNLSRDRSNETSLIVERSKVNINQEEFIKTYSSFEGFCKDLNFNLILKSKYQGVLPDKEEAESIIQEELGFSLFIEEIIRHNQNNNKVLPIIGHNLLFDLLFIYEKCIDSLPENFYEWKKKINVLFPIIYDNKFMTTNLAKDFDNTKLEVLYKNMKKNKFDIYVDIKPDVVNGFAAYLDSESNSAFHDAGYDSIITGRCFIYLLKAFENNFEVENKRGTNHQIGNEVLKVSKSVRLKRGYIDFDNEQILDLSNKTILSMMETPFDLCDFDSKRQTYEQYSLLESKLKKVFQHVYVVILKNNNFYTIYDFVRLFENDYFNISVVKIEDNISFIQFIASNEQIFQSEGEKLTLLENLIEKSRLLDNVENILSYEYFNDNFIKIINF